MASTSVIVVEPAQGETFAGGEIAFQVTVQNRSDFVGQYELAFAGADPSWATFEPTQLAAFPGASATATLRLRVPAGVMPATYPIVIRAINQSDTTDEGRTLLRVTVKATATERQGVPAGTPPPPPLPEGHIIRGPSGEAPNQGPPKIFTTAPALRGASPGAGQLEVLLDRDSLTILPGARQSLNVILRNTGGTILPVELAVQGLPPAWITVEPLYVELAATEAAPGRVTVAPSADAPTGNYPLAIFASVRDMPALTVRLDLVLEIGEAGGILVELVPPQASGQASANYRVRITQSSTAPLNVTLYAADPEAALNFAFNPPAVYVPPSGEATSELSVQAVKGLVGIESRTFPFTVTATPSEGTARQATTQGRFIQQRTPAIGLTLAPSEATAPDRAEFKLTVRNPSTVQTSVRLSASDANNQCRFQLTPPALSVPAGGEAQATLLVAPARLSADPIQVIHNFVVSAEPSGGLLTAAQTSGKLIQTKMDLPGIRLVPASQSSTGSAAYTVQVTNPRPAPLDVELRAFDAANLVELKLSAAQLRIPAGGTAQARVSVRPTTGLLKGEARRPSEFTVEAQVPGLEQTAGARGTLVQTAGFDFGRLLPFLLVLVVLGACIFLASAIVPGIGAFLGDVQGNFSRFLTSVPTGLPFTPVPTITPTPTATRTPTATLPPIPFAIKGVTAKVSPTSANACPVTLNFSAEIEVSAPGGITYVWEWSDGSATPPKTLNFSGPGKQSVTESRSFNSNGVVGGHVKITAPPSPDSNQATANLNCPAAPTPAPPAPTRTPTPFAATLPPPVFAGNYNGAWTTNFGTMNLSQSGTTLAGSYFNGFMNQSGTVNGLISGLNLTGNYSIGGGSGPIQWTLAGDQQSFTGKWGGTQDWCGARAGANFPQGCGFTGVWTIRILGGSGGTRTMNLTQKGTAVTGTYNNGSANGTINGTVSYAGSNVTLNGTWSVSGSTGPLRFFLLDYNGTRFNGNYNTSNEWCGWREGSAQPSPCLRN